MADQPLNDLIDPGQDEAEPDGREGYCQERQQNHELPGSRTRMAALITTRNTTADPQVTSNTRSILALIIRIITSTGSRRHRSVG